VDDLPVEAERVITRATADRAKELVIWTVPPGPQELTQMMDLTGAHTVTVAARHLPDDSAEAFLKRLGGLIKYAQKAYGGEISVLKLAAATAQREATVRHGLDWLIARGEIGVEWLDGDWARVRVGGQASDAVTIAQVQDALKALLSETAAFRAFFRHARLEGFFGL
jgi:hypothetical protein